MTRALFSSRSGTIVAKSLFGLLIFVSTTVAWSRFRNDLMSFFPLPGSGGPSGACAIWFVGSSSIYRWESMADDMAPWRVNNRGVNGASVKEVAARMKAERGNSTPDYIVFYIGENDIAAGQSSTEVARDVEALVLTARQRMPRVRSIVLGLKPSPARWSSRPEQLRFNALARAFENQQRSSHFIDVGGTLLVNGRPGPFYMPDGIHLDANGYRLWGHAVRRAFERVIPAADVERCGGRKQVAA